MLDVRDFFNATTPSRTLNIEKPDDRELYIDFSAVRGGQIIQELKDNISFFSPDSPTCTLFTGHIGCGKSTELLRLKQELEEEGFYVIYFESDDDLEMADVDIGDVLLAIARRVSQHLESLQLAEPKGLRAILQGAAKILTTEIEFVEASGNVPMVGDVSVSAGGEFSLSLGIGKITAKAKNDATLRDRLNNYLGPQKNKLVEAINAELLEPAIARLKQLGKKGLVVIVDNLDRIDNRPKAHGRPQQEYLFIDQSDCLRNLHCHKVYTMPLALNFTGERQILNQRFPEDSPRVLPMVPVRFQDGQVCEEGLGLLRQMVLARAFPKLTVEERWANLTQVFDSLESLDRLCNISGGHIRNLLRILNSWILKSGRTLPLTRERLDNVIRSYRNDTVMHISEEEWELLRQVRQQKRAWGEEDYQKLIYRLLVFEYRDQDGVWFDVNPILLEAKELQL